MKNSTKAHFSLVRGGLIYYLEQHLGLVNEQSLGLAKRILIFWLLTWVPIMVLDLIRFLTSGGAATSHAVYSDLSISIRLLFSGALLIASEALVEFRLGLVIKEFQDRNILEDTGSFFAILSNAKENITGRLGMSIEAVILVVIVFSGLFSYESQYIGPLQDWKAGAGTEIPAALAWYIGIALPFYQFLQLRWLWRFSIWVKILWGISRLRMKLVVTHPDTAGGLGFIALAQEAFAVLWVAVSAGSASMIAFRVKRLGDSLVDFYTPIGILVAAEPLLLLVPMFFFLPHLIILRRSGLLDYGKFSSRYVQAFDQKWIRHTSTHQESPLGSSDIQSLADLGNSYDRVVKTRMLPIGLRSVFAIVVASAFPFLPLALLLVPMEQIARLLLKMVTS